MKISEIKDKNGTSLVSYAELLAEKARDAGIAMVVLLVSPDERGSDIHQISVNLKTGELGKFLRVLSREIDKQVQ